MSDFDNIWNQGKDLPEDKLMAYLEGRLSPEEQHEVEKLLADEGPESDAIEGLKNMSATEAKKMIDRLNRRLHQKTDKKRKKRSYFMHNPTQFFSLVVLILLFCILGYLVLKLLAR